MISSRIHKKKTRKKQLSIDSFLKTGGSLNITAENSSGRQLKKQTTLESLKGVVVLESLEEMKQTLLAEKDPKSLVRTLEKLSKKQPSLEILKSTKIGKIVKRLRKHSDSSVADAAEGLYLLWRCHIVDVAMREKVDVRCDLATEQIRSRSRRHLVLSLRQPTRGGFSTSAATSSTIEESGVSSDVLAGAKNLEREVFFSAGHLVHRPLYSRVLRQLADKLRGDEEARRMVLGGEGSRGGIARLVQSLGAIVR